MKTLKLIKSKECYSKSVDINEDDICMDFFDGIDDDKLRACVNNNMSIRAFCEFEGKAIFLDYRYDYILGKDSSGTTILVPLKKK